ncbi:MAG TPA: glycosyltransferase family protein [Syntrophorhabdales bacterium]|nr:glycosyltransferase family protein [Syntrophorhabdales bacterium]
MILCVIQVRMSSSRLPGKALLSVLDRPLLSWVINRVRLARTLDRIVVATTLEADDDAIVSLCRQEAVECFRGSKDDVVDRFYQCAAPYSPLGVLRITADCPLIDPGIIDMVVGRFLSAGGSLDLVSNDGDTYPDGLDAGIYSFRALEKIYREASLPSDREHITPYIWNHPELFSIEVIPCSENLSRFRLTVDYEEDLELVRKVYAALYPSNPSFSWLDVIDFLIRNPEIYKLNSHYTRNEGYLESLRKDTLIVEA